MLIKRRWCKEIFDNGKVWELRDRACRFRGRFAIAESGSKRLVGEANIIDCIEVAKRVGAALLPAADTRIGRELFVGHPVNLAKHKVEDLGTIKYKRTFAWVLDSVIKYEAPVPYIHPQGAVTWVRTVERRVGSRTLRLGNGLA